MHVPPLSLPLLHFACLAFGNTRHDHHAHLGGWGKNGLAQSIAVDPVGGVTLDQGAAPSPFCQKLCNKSNLEEKGAKTCKDLAENDCKSLNFYRKNGGELRLCVWQPEWKCTEDWTTACISDRPWSCSDSKPKGLDLCESICYKTDLRSLDTFCRKLSFEECSSGQFYESDEHGNRRICEKKGNRCLASSWCPAENLTCPGSTLFHHGEVEELNGTMDEMLSECRSMCYKTNTVVSGLSCSDLGVAHCSSGQFYETDWHGVRRMCVYDEECTADPSHSCPRSVPLCSDEANLQKSHPFAPNRTPSENSSAKNHLPDKPIPDMTKVPAFCLSLCEKTNSRSMNASCSDLPAASCESQEFYETDHDGKRRLCQQKGGQCITDFSAVCEEHFPICNISAAPMDLRAHEAVDQSRCFLYCDKINTRSRKQSCQALSSSECLSGIFYESDHEGNRAMCSYSPTGCRVNVSTSCRAQQPICHGTNVSGQRPSASVVRSSKFAVHSSYGSASPAANEAFGGPPVASQYHSGASARWMFLTNFALLIAID